MVTVTALELTFPARCLIPIFQTEAERQRREAGVQQAMEWAQVMFVCMYVCMFFKDISRSRALSGYKLVSRCSPVNSRLHRHDIIRVRFLTIARHVKIEKIVLH